MNLLIITPYLPYPLDSGGNIAQYLMIDYLRNEYCITIVPFNADESNLKKLRGLWPNVEIIAPFFQAEKKKNS